MGAPIGNQNARKGKWSEALSLAVEVEDPILRRRRLHIIADKLIEKAQEGDIQAIKELGDRLDGKPKQQVEMTGAEGGDLVLRLVYGAAQQALTDQSGDG